MIVSTVPKRADAVDRPERPLALLIGLPDGDGVRHIHADANRAATGSLDLGDYGLKLVGASCDEDNRCASRGENAGKMRAQTGRRSRHQNDTGLHAPG